MNSLLDTILLVYFDAMFWLIGLMLMFLVVTFPPIKDKRLHIVLVKASISFLAGCFLGLALIILVTRPGI